MRLRYPKALVQISWSALLSVLPVILPSPGLAASPIETSISGPVLGYFFDPSLGGLRSILGIPGSSTLGALVDTGVALRGAEVSPRQDYALGLTAEPAAVVLVGLPAGKIAAQLAEGAPSRMALSPTGSAAALYYQDKQAVRVITGLPLNPAPGVLDVSWLPAPVAALAVSDDGIVLLAAGQNLYAAGGGLAAPALVTTLGSATGLSFFENSRDALIADAGRDEVVWIRDVTGAAERLKLAGASDGLSGPIAVAAAGQTRRVLAATRTAIALLDLDGGPPALLPCSCAVAGMYRLNGSSVFRLNAPSGDPMLLLDAGTPAPRLLFVASGAPRPLPPRERSRP